MAAPVAILSALLVRAIVPVRPAVFIASERRAPVLAIDVRLFRVTAFAAAVAAVFGSTVILHTSMILIPIFTQNLLAASAAASGTVMFVYFGVGALISPAGGRLSDLIGRRMPAVAGMLFMTVGLAGLWRWAGSVTLTQVALLLGLIGLGSGLSGTPRQTSAIESVPPHAAGMAAGAAADLGDRERAAARRRDGGRDVLHEPLSGRCARREHGRGDPGERRNGYSGRRWIRAAGARGMLCRAGLPGAARPSYRIAHLGHRRASSLVF
ncbi:MAG: MFS transporter [Armatimonadetes bacterium]|nr:MFS transporter [Armatimonadota bacterium]